MACTWRARQGERSGCDEVLVSHAASNLRNAHGSAYDHVPPLCGATGLSSPSMTAGSSVHRCRTPTAILSSWLFRSHVASGAHRGIQACFGTSLRHADQSHPHRQGHSSQLRWTSAAILPETWELAQTLILPGRPCRRAPPSRTLPVPPAPAPAGTSYLHGHTP